MLGTLNGGLDARAVKLSGDQIWADVVGYNEVRDGLPVLVRVHVHYHLIIPEGTRETVDRLLAKHADKCPTAASLKGAVEVTWDADIRERSGAEGPGPV
jgi:organic hydroperoxide reductase OsmC/OhrA